MQFLNKYLLMVCLIPLSFTLPASDFDLKSGDIFRSFLGDEYSLKLMEPYEATITHLQRRQTKYRQEKAFLQYLFRYVHRKHLKRYKQYSLLSEVMQSGTYDCVSGTALYALLLEGLGYTYQIWEMDYHVYLSLETEGESLVFESTDPMHGFVDRPDEKEQHRQYFEHQAQLLQEKSNNTGSLIHRPVSLTQLAGLQLYNRAINAWNQKEKNEAQQYAEQAFDYYPAERIAYLSKFVVR